VEGERYLRGPKLLREAKRAIADNTERPHWRNQLAKKGGGGVGGVGWGATSESSSSQCASDTTGLGSKS